MDIEQKMQIAIKHAEEKEYTIVLHELKWGTLDYFRLRRWDLLGTPGKRAPYTGLPEIVRINDKGELERADYFEVLWVLRKSSTPGGGDGQQHVWIKQ